MAKRLQKQKLEEFQPPEKKLVNQTDVLIKELAKKQANTKITLDGQLLKEKIFEKSSPIISITNFQSGECSFSKLKQIISKTSELEDWQSAGLCNEDIQIYKDFKDGIEVLFKKHPNYNKDLLMKRIELIEKTLNTHRITEEQKNLYKSEDECVNTEKVETNERKLLKFALENNKKQTEALPHPMDGLNDLKCELESKINLSNLTDGDINKIRRKARKLQHRLDIVNAKEKINVTDSIKNNCNVLERKSKWDVKTKSAVVKPNIETVKKVYDCKPQNLYTIKNGDIVRLESVNNFECSGEKMSVEDIRKLSKFENYTEGNLNNVLYIKNLSKVSVENLKLIIFKYANNVDTKNMEIKIMTGKMKGQALISFSDSHVAAFVLNKINGLIVNGKPMIIQYGKKT